jgi:short-subunit dehydrogenase
VLNVASVAGFVPGPGMAVYYASKAFVLSFTEALAGELAGTGVKVMALCPGPTKTNFFKVAHANDAQLVRVADMTAKAVAVEGHLAFRGGRVVMVSGWRNRLLVLLIRLLPRVLVRRIVKKFNGI